MADRKQFNINDHIPFQWYETSNILPPLGVEVLCASPTIKSSEAMRLIKCINDGKTSLCWYNNSNNANIPVDNIVAWCPKPEPAKWVKEKC